MIIATWRSLVAVALAHCVVFASTLAPEHVHEVDDHHSHAVVHRHFEIHDHDQTHDGAEISDGDDDLHVVWLDNVGLQPTAYHSARPHAILAVQSEFLPPLPGWIATSVCELPPPHGPPRANASLRGPPLPVLRLT